MPFRKTIVPISFFLFFFSFFIIFCRREIHLELIKCARNINEAYDLHTLISIFIAFILSILVTFNAYYFIITMNYNMELLQSFTFLFWIFYCFFNVVIISHVCSKTVTEVCPLKVFIIFTLAIRFFFFFLFFVNFERNVE